MDGSRLESMINETLAGTNRKLSEMSGAVVESIIDDKNTLLGSMLKLAASPSGTGNSNYDSNQTMTSEVLNQLIGSASGTSTSTTTAAAAASSIEMSQSERLFWVLIFSVMVLVAAGGNTIVVYIVATNKEMKSVTNYFLVNLSLADTMVSTLNVIFNFISMLNR